MFLQSLDLSLMWFASLSLLLSSICRRRSLDAIRKPHEPNELDGLLPAVYFSTVQRCDSFPSNITLFSLLSVPVKNSQSVNTPSTAASKTEI